MCSPTGLALRAGAEAEHPAVEAEYPAAEAEYPAAGTEARMALREARLARRVDKEPAAARDCQECLDLCAVHHLGHQRKLGHFLRIRKNWHLRHQILLDPH